MSASIASHNTANPGNGVNVTVTKPSGLAVGDLMIFHYAFADATDTANSMFGWTHEVANYGGILKTGLFWKIADSSDVSASNFTLGFSGTVANPIGAILRIIDYNPSDLLNENKDTGANGDTNLSMSVTPLTTDSLLLMFIGNSEGESISAYAIATDNPTWTELYDEAGGVTTGLACAYATRTQASATGNSSFSSSPGGDTEDFYGILVSIGAIINVTVSGATGILPLVGNSGTATGGATIAGSVGVLQLVGNAGTFASPAPDWSGTDKNSSTWVNEDKS